MEISFFFTVVLLNNFNCFSEFSLDRARIAARSNKKGVGMAGYCYQTKWVQQYYKCIPASSVIATAFFLKTQLDAALESFSL